MGYHIAGFEVVGVDIEPQPRYPFEFHCADALEVLRTWDLSRFDMIHASPPCQAHSQLGKLWRAFDSEYDKRHADLIPDTRRALQWSGKPYVIENVIGAPLINPVLLCGSMFGLKVYRHRLFETNPYLLAPVHAPHHDNCPAVGRGMSNKGFISVTGTGGFGIPNGWQYAQAAMGIDWMSRSELSQATPPAYTHWIGQQMLAALESPCSMPS
jgi:DNA (cytosine-5)-methyltransferase 1